MRVPDYVLMTLVALTIAFYAVLLIANLLQTRPAHIVKQTVDKLAHPRALACEAEIIHETHIAYQTS